MAGRFARSPSDAIRSAALAPDGRMVVVATRCLTIRTSSGSRSRPAGPLDQPPRDQQDGFVEPGRVALRGEDALVRGGTRGWQRDPLQRSHRPRAAPVPRRLADAGAAEGRHARAIAVLCDAASAPTDGRWPRPSSGWIHVWDVESGTLRRKIRYPTPMARLLALAPDGQTLATSDFRDGEDRGEDKIRLYDVATGEASAHARARRRPSRRAGVLARRHQALHRVPPGHGDRLGRAPRARDRGGKTEVWLRAGRTTTHAASCGVKSRIYNSRFTLTYFLTDVMQGACSEQPPSPLVKMLPPHGVVPAGYRPHHTRNPSRESDQTIDNAPLVGHHRISRYGLAIISKNRILGSGPSGRTE